MLYLDKYRSIYEIQVLSRGGFAVPVSCESSAEQVPFHALHTGVKLGGVHMLL